MTEPKKRGLRPNGTHRWSDLETKTLVHHVLNAIESGIAQYEKPTAQQFYTSQCADEVLEDIDWRTKRNKMRHLRDTYIKARNWNEQVGSELFKSDKKRVEARILTICPHYDQLETIFGPILPVDPIKVNSIPSNDYMSSSTDMNEDSIMNMETTEVDDDEHDSNNDDSIQRIFPKVEKEELLQELAARTPVKRATSITTNSSTQKRSKQNERETNTTQNNVEGEAFEELQISPQLKYELESTKLEFERQKLNLDMKYHQEKMSHKCMQLNLEKEKFEFEKRKILEDQRLRKYEIDKQFEIKKLEIERDERLQQLELELKYKYKNIEEFDEKTDYI